MPLRDEAKRSPATYFCIQAANPRAGAAPHALGFQFTWFPLRPLSKAKLTFYKCVSFFTHFQDSPYSLESFSDASVILHRFSFFSGDRSINRNAFVIANTHSNLKDGLNLE